MHITAKNLIMTLLESDPQTAEAVNQVVANWTKQKPAPTVPGTVYVVAWNYEDSCGFDWYFKRTDADKAFQQEGRSGNFGGTVYLFDYAPKAEAVEDITTEISHNFDELCNGDNVFRKGVRRRTNQVATEG